MMAASTLHYTVFWVLLQQEIMEMTTRSLKCRKKTITSIRALFLYRPDILWYCHPANSVKALKGLTVKLKKLRTAFSVHLFTYLL